MKMTKREARAILACQKTIEKALDVCLEKLGNDESDYATSYWMAHIRDSIGGSAYGSMPIGAAHDLINPDN